MKITTMPGAIIDCPICHAKVKYSWLTGMLAPNLHFYAKGSNNILMRTEWGDRIRRLLDGGVSDFDLEVEVEMILKSLSDEQRLEFHLWNNVKCPKCNSEFPYSFKKNIRMRLSDELVVLIDESVLDADDGVSIIHVEVNC